MALAVALTAAAGADTATSPTQAGLLRGDGRVDAFYLWPNAIPPKPGVMLRTLPLPHPLGLTQSATQIRILYSSTSGIDGKTPVAVSGILYTPKGNPPAGGWPVVAWAHGTVGVADVCAPSWDGHSYRDVEYLNTWLDQGYAIVASDYEGLGTPGLHPYLNARSAAYSVLDSVRAALASNSRLANKVVIIGQSQGGGAAFASAAYAPQYAPDVHLRGTVATGVPFLSPESLASALPADPDKVNPALAYGLYAGLMLLQADPSLKATDLFGERALPLLDRARITCIAQLRSDVTSAGLTPANTLLPGFAKAAMANMDLLAYPTVHLESPLFVGTGQDDVDVPTANQLELVKAACAAGTTVQAHVYIGLDHSTAVNGSLKDSIPFVRSVMDGNAIAPICEPVPQ